MQKVATTCPNSRKLLLSRKWSTLPVIEMPSYLGFLESAGHRKEVVVQIAECIKYLPWLIFFAQVARYLIDQIAVSDQTSETNYLAEHTDL
ncbi:hypothetical protein BSY240_1175 [Agrobacterium sp. RAC06]|nr:hypothetical protein BSY240_1175 [Agrobacterium sp. RAC06]